MVKVQKKRPNTNPSTPHGGTFNIPSSLRPKLELMTPVGGDQKGFMGFTPYAQSFLKKDGKHKLTLQDVEPSPKFVRDTFVLSPLFSTRNQMGSFFQGFTPRGFTPKGFPTRGFLPTPTDGGDGVYGEDMLRSMMKDEFNMQSNGVTDHEEMKNKYESNDNENNFQRKGLSLDVDLINDSFSIPPMTKSPNLQLPISQPNSKGSMKKVSDWNISPNASSFQLRKKIDN